MEELIYNPYVVGVVVTVVGGLLVHFLTQKGSQEERTRARPTPREHIQNRTPAVQSQKQVTYKRLFKVILIGAALAFVQWGVCSATVLLSVYLLGSDVPGWLFGVAISFGIIVWVSRRFDQSSK